MRIIIREYRKYKHEIYENTKNICEILYLNVSEYIKNMKGEKRGKLGTL